MILIYTARADIFLIKLLRLFTLADGWTDGGKIERGASCAEDGGFKRDSRHSAMRRTIMMVEVITTWASSLC